MGLGDFARRTAAQAVDSAVRIGQGVATRVLASPVMTERVRTLAARDRLWRGDQYEGKGLSDSWDKLPAGRKIPLRNQKPSVQYDLPKLVVNRPTALLFGENRFPEISFEPTDPALDATEINKWLADIADEGGLAATALTWSRLGGAQGSGILTWAVVEGEIDFEAHQAQHCTPTFHARKRTRLVQLEKRYQFKKPVQVRDDYTNVLTVREMPYWHREVWTETTHTLYDDAPVGDGSDPRWEVSPGNEVTHDFGFVPAVWVKNLDDGDCASIDGESLLDGLHGIPEDIDRTVTQKSRAVRYNQEPERVYLGLSDDQRKGIQTGNGATTAMPSRKEGGDVLLLELKGEGQRVAEEHAVAQRGRALEVSRVTIPDPERLLAAATSGSALRILFGATLELVGELRQSYGRGLRTLLGQILQAAREGKLNALGRLTTPPPKVIPAGKVKLAWNDPFDASPADIQAVATAAASLKAAGILDTETCLRWLSSYFGIKDVHAVLARVADEAEKAYGAMLTRPGPPGPNATEDNTPTEPYDKPAADT